MLLSIPYLNRSDGVQHLLREDRTRQRYEDILRHNCQRIPRLKLLSFSFLCKPARNTDSKLIWHSYRFLGFFFVLRYLL